MAVVGQDPLDGAVGVQPPDGCVDLVVGLGSCLRKTGHDGARQRRLISGHHPKVGILTLLEEVPRNDPRKDRCVGLSRAHRVHDGGRVVVFLKSGDADLLEIIGIGGTLERGERQSPDVLKAAISFGIALRHDYRFGGHEQRIGQVVLGLGFGGSRQCGAGHVYLAFVQRGEHLRLILHDDIGGAKAGGLRDRIPHLDVAAARLVAVVDYARLGVLKTHAQLRLSLRPYTVRYADRSENRSNNKR